MRIAFYTVAFILFCRCTQIKPEVKIPANVLTKEKFSQLICDFTLAEAAASINIKNAEGNKNDSVYSFNPLFDNGIDRKTFDTTVYFYSHNPRLFKEVYELSLEKLSRMQSTRN